ncbi:MAG: tyrosine-type recombinase/integrase, partial [Thomasclavelia ramosa]
IKETKTPASCAIVPLPSLLVPILKAWFAENESNLVAPDNDMNLLDPQTVKTFLERYSKRTGVHISSHMFRHTFATRLWENKVDVKIAQRLLRHESYQTTLDVYTSLENENLNNVVNNVYS